MKKTQPCTRCDKPHDTLCDRCQRVICYACEVSGGKASQMLCLDCNDEMATNARTVARWGTPRNKRTKP